VNRLLKLVARVGALTLGLLLVVGVAGMVVRVPWEPACVVRTAAGEPLAHGSVAEMRGYVVAALAATSDTGSATPETVGLAGRGPSAGNAFQGEEDLSAADLRAALRSGPALTCTVEPIAATAAPKDLSVGLTPRARELRAEVRAAFGRIPTGGYGPQEVLPGRAAGGEHSLGRAIDFFFRPAGDRAQQRRGWLLANWAVAHAERLGIRTVIYSDHMWTARRSAQGWRDYRFRGPNPDSAVNRHLDHVHIDVA
jgi:hypothetical protein